MTQNQTLYAYWTRTGEAVELGGYKWHVIGEYQDEQGRTLETLLMDAGQLGDNSNMSHCGSANNSSNNCTFNGTYYVYSWDKSLIRTYLNGAFLTDLESKISNEIVSTSICVDQSTGDGSTTYGGYLMSELDALEKKELCSNKENDKVRLISISEYYNMSPYYTNISSNYPNVENITRLSSDDSSWFKSSDIDSDDSWWTMGATNMMDMGFYPLVEYVPSYGFGFDGSDRAYDVRPVITIVK